MLGELLFAGIKALLAIIESPWYIHGPAVFFAELYDQFKRLPNDQLSALIEARPEELRDALGAVGSHRIDHDYQLVHFTIDKYRRKHHCISTLGKKDQRIGSWVLDEFVGHGGYGEVWRAHHHLWQNRIVALKIARGSRFFKILRREMTIIKGLDHPHIVAMLDADLWFDPPYLVLEYVDGVTLRHLIPAQGMPLIRAVYIATQVLEALQFAHSRGIIHRDLKPENVLVNQEGQAKVTDFGLAVGPTNTECSIANSGSMPVSSLVAGTLAYMPFEQLQGQQVDHRCDLFAFGLIWFQMLTGRLPAGFNETQPSIVRPELDRTCDHVFRSATASLDKRAKSATELLQLLAALSSGSPHSVRTCSIQDSGETANTIAHTPIYAAPHICQVCDYEPESLKLTVRDIVRRFTHGSAGLGSP